MAKLHRNKVKCKATSGRARDLTVLHIDAPRIGHLKSNTSNDKQQAWELGLTAQDVACINSGWGQSCLCQQCVVVGWHSRLRWL